MNFILFTALLASAGLCGVAEARRVGELPEAEHALHQKTDRMLGTSYVERHDAAVKQTAIACWLIRTIFAALAATFMAVNKELFL